MQSLKTKVYKIQGMNCASCASIIQMEIEDLGIPCRCSYALESLEITTDHNEKLVKETIIKLGYILL